MNPQDTNSTLPDVRAEGDDVAHSTEGRENRPEVSVGKPILAPDGHHLTDAGNAERLVKKARGELRYIPKWRQWMAWGGKAWEVDDDNVRIEHAAREIADGLWQLVLGLEGKERDAVVSWAKRS